MNVWFPSRWRCFGRLWSLYRLEWSWKKQVLGRRPLKAAAASPVFYFLARHDVLSLSHMVPCDELLCAFPAMNAPRIRIKVCGMAATIYHSEHSGSHHQDEQFA